MYIEHSIGAIHIEIVIKNDGVINLNIMHVSCYIDLPSVDVA